MRIRTIKPEFWSHPVIGKLSDETKLLAIGLLNLADDEGYFYADQTIVRNALRPFDEGSSKTRRGLDDLSRIGWISIRKHHTQGEIGLVINFRKHQRIDRPTPSKIAIYYDSSNARRGLDEGSSQEQGTGNREQGKDQGTPLPPKGGSPWMVEFGVELPESLRTNECLEAAKLWLAYKREKRQGYKPIGLQQSLTKWGKEFTKDNFKPAVEHSIACGWRGIFTPKDNGHGNPANGNGYVDPIVAQRNALIIGAEDTIANFNARDPDAPIPF